jgi:Kef-type K+ transport system membrane component KefB
MNTRGLVELIALNIGYDLKILSPQIFAMLIIMALVTTCMAGPFLTFGDDLRARKRLAINPA